MIPAFQSIITVSYNLPGLYLVIFTLVIGVGNLDLDSTFAPTTFKSRFYLEGIGVFRSVKVEFIG